MEDILLDFYSALPGISQDLLDSLYQDDLLFTITLVYLISGVGFAGFFYFNPFEFKKSFWQKTHWMIVLAVSVLTSFLFTVGTCLQNGFQEGIPAFIGIGFIAAILNALIYTAFSFIFKGMGNAVTRYTPV